MDAIDIAAQEAGVCRKAILKRIRTNKALGLTGDDLLSVRRGGNYKITEQQAREFWQLICSGIRADDARRQTGLTRSQGDNIRCGRSWNHITGLEKVVYESDEY